MKKTILMVFILTMLSTAFCQEKDAEYKTIFGDGRISTTGFGAFDMQFSSIGGSYAFGAGGSGGVLLGGKVFFGGFGMGCTVNKTFKINETTIFENANVGYGGLMFGYIINGKSAIHPALFLQTGWGGVNFYENYPASQNYWQTDNIFVLNPSVEVEMNITRFFRLALGANYQFATGVDSFDNYGNSDFSGPGAKVSFRFGWF